VTAKLVGIANEPMVTIHTKPVGTLINKHCLLGRMSGFLCTECGVTQPNYESAGNPPYCIMCGVEMSPADGGVLKLVNYDQ
jgi:ribosomal protein S27E